MSVAIWRIWINYYDNKILNLYFLHLFFNMIWSIIFFGFHQIGLALLDLIIILIFIVLLMKIYYLKDKISFSLMVPYFLWSGYALVLNFNMRPTVKKKGSAIFIHLTNNYKKTLGCIALRKDDFLILLKLIDKKIKIKIC